MAENNKKGLYLGSKTATHPSWFKESFLDLEEDISDASDNNKRLVVYFWQPGCPYCNQLWEDNFSQKETVDYFRKNFEIVALNMWGDRDVVSIAGNDYTEKSFSEALNIQYTPTLLFFDENKKVIHQLNGYVPPNDFNHSLHYVSEKHERTQTYAEYISSINETSKKGGHLAKDDFFLNSNKGNKIDLEKTMLSADNKNKYLAIFFEAKDCKNCNLLHDKTLQDPATRSLVKQFISVQLDRYSEQQLITPRGINTDARRWANTLNISYLPAVVFFNNDGKEVMRIDAQMRTFHVQSVFDFVLSGAYKTETNFQRWISARAEKVREEGIDVDIWAY